MRELDYAGMGARIRQVRKAKGWSQDVLAKKCGISMSFLGHIERGTRIMSLETFTSICTALDTNADEILWGVAQPSDALLDMWQAPPQKAYEKTGDSYSMYIKIMKSVAEIMNGA
ncbi:MAG: helix-turn-helix domain-containing protein [Eubacterium sp.]|nr:helix-turn-helix domain-containing protein [Eubacterium sp.]